MAIAELGQRAAAEAQHQDVLRALQKELEAHHRLGVVQLQREGILEAHAALDQRQREMQRARRAVVDDKGLVVGARQHLAQHPLGVAILRLDEADGVGFGKEGARQDEDGRNFGSGHGNRLGFR